VNVGLTGVGKGVGVASLAICPLPQAERDSAMATNKIYNLFIIG
jgi:hypothetical protein